MKAKKPRKILMSLIVILVILIISAFVYFGLTGFSIGLSKVDPLPEQINLGLDLTGGVYAVYQADQEDLTGPVFAAKIDATMGALRNRLDAKGFTEATVVAQGSDRIRVEVPINDTTEMRDPSAILAFIGEPAKLDGGRSWARAGVASYEWTLSNGSKAVGPVVERIYQRPGTYSEILKVSESAGRRAYDFAVVQVVGHQQNVKHGEGA